MKALQPEMVRLKELHKNDKMKLQQEMMALYKKEKVNPMSGCLIAPAAVSPFILYVWLFLSKPKGAIIGILFFFRMSSIWGALWGENVNDSSPSRDLTRGSNHDVNLASLEIPRIDILELSKSLIASAVLIFRLIFLTNIP